MEIKTLDGWHQYAAAHEHHDWDAYCRPGDQVDEEVYDYFLDILPPKRMSKGYFQVGEPSDSRKNPKTGRFESTYPTFVRDARGHFYYLGACFAGKSDSTELWIDHKTLRNFLAATYRLDDAGLQGSRPHILCKDGFTFSVQAGKQFFSSPREDLPDGAYTHVELGRLSESDASLTGYAENVRHPTKTVYFNVPLAVVESLIEKHGGFYESRMLEFASICKEGEGSVV